MFSRSTVESFTFVYVKKLGQRQIVRRGNVSTNSGLTSMRQSLLLTSLPICVPERQLALLSLSVNPQQIQQTTWSSLCDSDL
jgi:hypothetical protein